MPRLRHSLGTAAPTLLSNTRPQTHISITALPWNLSLLLSLHLPQNSPPSPSFPQLPLSASLHPQSTLLFLPSSSSSPPITTDPSAYVRPPPPTHPPLPFLRTGLKVLFITRAGNMALKNHPIIIFHPANSTHSH